MKQKTNFNEKGITIIALIITIILLLILNLGYLFLIYSSKIEEETKIELFSFSHKETILLQYL